MKKIIPVFILTLFLCASAAVAGDGFPTELAGFKLGTEVVEYSDVCNLDQAIPVSDAPFLSESLIESNALPGVRGGSLGYGNCLNKDKLVRIKLKFHNRGQGFFNKLHGLYEDKFGEPDRYIGDAFKNVIAWEWIFKNDKGEEVSLVLMWSRDKEIRPGVSIKMTHVTLKDKEFECYKAMDENKQKNGQKSTVRNIDQYVPR